MYIFVSLPMENSIRKETCAFIDSLPTDDAILKNPYCQWYIIEFLKHLTKTNNPSTTEKRSIKD